MCGDECSFFTYTIDKITHIKNNFTHSVAPIQDNFANRKNDINLRDNVQFPTLYSHR